MPTSAGARYSVALEKIDRIPTSPLSPIVSLFYRRIRLLIGAWICRDSGILSIRWRLHIYSERGLLGLNTRMALRSKKLQGMLPQQCGMVVEGHCGLVWRSDHYISFVVISHVCLAELLAPQTYPTETNEERSVKRMRKCGRIQL
jgi:hypothetical protein